MASSKMVIFGKDFNPKKDMQIKEKSPNSSGNGHSAGIVNVNTSRSLFIQTPMMLTWGINEIRDKATKKLQGYSMSLQFPRDEDENNDEEMQKFFESMLEFDELIKDEAIRNSMKWCKQKTLTKESVKMLYDPPVVKYSRYKEGHELEGEIDHSKKPTLRVKVPFYNNEFGTEIYDVKMKRLFPRNPDNLTPPDIIGKGDNVIVIMQCGGVWFANNKFGVTWKLHQVILQKKENLRGKCFIQLNDKQRELMEAASAAAPPDDDFVKKPTQDVDAEGDEEPEAGEEDSMESLLKNKGGPRFKNLKLNAPSAEAEDGVSIDLEGMEDDLN